MAEAEHESIWLPRSIKAVWGVDERPGRGPKPGLSLERIVEAAIRLADRDGLEAVSMSRVAKELGASTMALYRYVDAKDELLQLMVDGAYGLPPDEPAGPTTVRERLCRWAWAEQRCLRAHPWILRVPLIGPPITPNAAAWLERCLEALGNTGLTESEKIEIALLLSVFTRGIEAATLEVREAFAHAGQSDEEAMSGYGRALQRLIAGRSFPALERLIASGALEQEDDLDGEFRFGLDRVLDGIDAFIARRGNDSAQTP